jgi:cytochrome c556
MRAKITALENIWDIIQKYKQQKQKYANDITLNYKNPCITK